MPLVSRTRSSGPGRGLPPRSGRALLTVLMAVCPPALCRTAHAAAPGVPGAPEASGLPGATGPGIGASGITASGGSGGASAIDLILPVAVLVITVLTAGYAYVRRRRRITTRTTPRVTTRRPYETGEEPHDRHRRPGTGR